MPVPPESGSGSTPADRALPAAAGAEGSRHERPYRPGGRRLGAGVGAVAVLGAIGVGLAQLPSAGSGGSAAPAAGTPRPGGAVPTPTPPGPTASPTTLGGLVPTPTPPAAHASAPASTAGPTRSVPQRPGASPTPAVPVRTSPSPSTGGAVATGFLSVRPEESGGSDSWWSQSTVTVTLSAPVSSLKVAVRIAQTGGVADAGTWSSAGGSVQAAVASDGSALDYEFTLTPGTVLPAGRYVFAVQYSYGDGWRSTAHDLYAVVGVAAGSGTRQGTGGHF